MNSINTTVVSMHPSGRIVLLRKDPDGCQQFYVIAKNAVNLVQNPKCSEFFFGAVVQVHGIKKELEFVNNEFEPSFAGSVHQYSFNDVPKNFIAAAGSAEPRQFIVAVVQSEYDEYVGVVSAARTDKHFAVGSKGVDFRMFTFAIGYPMILDVFYKLVTRGSNLWMMEDLETKTEYFQQLEKFHLKLAVEPRPPIQTVTYYDLRTLTKEEKEMVDTRASTTRDLTLEEAETFIRDPIICSLAAQTFMKGESIAPLQLNSPVTVTFDGEKCIVSVVVLREIFQKLTDIKTQDSWRIGNELTMKNESFLRGNPIALIYESYGKFPDDNQYFLVKFLVASRSNLMVKWMCKRDEYKNTIFLIGPPEDELSSAVESIISGFPRFFLRKNLFDVWRGYEQQPVPKEIPNDGVPYKVEGKSLDDTQLAAMRMAAGVPGFTCITAPPGSGKTFMISGLVKSIEEEWEDRRDKNVEDNSEDLKRPQFAIASTTNVAVTNALDSIHRHYPEMRVCRDYSVKAEEELATAGAASNEISLKYLIESHQLDDMIKDKKYFELYNKKEEITEALRQGFSSMSIYKGVSHLKNLKKIESQLAKEFLIQIEPTVYGTTAELMCRADGDKITHLIIDEASQMSQFHALALYCSLPGVTHVTLLGDSKQLGPHLVLPKACDMYKYQILGELTRLKNLEVCSHQGLKTVYRCHPMLVDIWLKPIYGDLTTGATEEERNYVKKYDLLQSRKNGAPTLMINVPGSSGTSGRNKTELEQVVKFLKYLKDRNVPDEDITILCHHRAQREAMITRLRDKGSVGSLGLRHPVYTVDSFQGKEAKIVLVLTTKTTKADDYDSICRALTFISDDNRETVAISRASHAMYIFGDWNKLGRMPFWRQFGPVLMEYGAVVDHHYDPIFQPFWFTAKDPVRSPIGEDEGPQRKRYKYQDAADAELVSHVNLSLKYAFDQHPSNRIRTEQKAKIEAETQCANFKEAFQSSGPLEVPSSLCRDPVITSTLAERKPEAMEVVMSLIPPPPLPPTLLKASEDLPPQPPKPKITADDVIDFQPSMDYTPSENTEPAVETLIDNGPTLIDVSISQPTLIDVSIPQPTLVDVSIPQSTFMGAAEPMDTQHNYTSLPFTFVPMQHISPPRIEPVVTANPAPTFQNRRMLPVVITDFPAPPTAPFNSMGRRFPTSSLVSSRPKIPPCPQNPVIKAKTFVATAEQRRAIVGLQNENCDDDNEDVNFDDKLGSGDLQIDRKYHEKTKRRLYERHNKTKDPSSLCKCHKVPCMCDIGKLLTEESTGKKEKEQNTVFGFYVEQQFNAVFDNENYVPRSWVNDLDDTVLLDRVEPTGDNTAPDYSVILEMALLGPE